MAGKSDYLENHFLDHILRNTAIAAPATVYVGLYTAAPTDAGGGTEVSGGSYARQAATFAAASGGSCASNAVINFPVASAGWGAVIAFGVFDAVAAGNLLYWGTVTSTTINSGDQFQIPSGQLTVTED